MIDLFEKCRSDGGYFGALRSRHDRYFTQPVLEERPGPHMKFEGRDVVMWAINDYLGLAGRREIAEAASTAVERFGPGAPMGSRMLTGNTEHHMELESRLAPSAGNRRRSRSTTATSGFSGPSLPWSDPMTSSSSTPSPMPR